MIPRRSKSEPKRVSSRIFKGTTLRINILYIRQNQDSESGPQIWRQAPTSTVAPGLELVSRILRAPAWVLGGSPSSDLVGASKISLSGNSEAQIQSKLGQGPLGDLGFTFGLVCVPFESQKVIGNVPQILPAKVKRENALLRPTLLSQGSFLDSEMYDN